MPAPRPSPKDSLPLVSCKPLDRLSQLDTHPRDRRLVEPQCCFPTWSPLQMKRRKRGVVLAEAHEHVERAIDPIGLHRNTLHHDPIDVRARLVRPAVLPCLLDDAGDELACGLRPERRLSLTMQRVDEQDAVARGSAAAEDGANPVALLVHRHVHKVLVEDVCRLAPADDGLRVGARLGEPLRVKEHTTARIPQPVFLEASQEEVDDAVAQLVIGPVHA